MRRNSFQSGSLRLLASSCLCVCLGLLVTACSSLPPRTASLPDGQTGQVNVRGATGQVSAQAGRSTLRRLAGEGQGDLLTHHLQTLSASGDTDLIRGNRTRLLVDGPATFTAMKAAIAQARGRVYLESYIVEDGGVAAEVADLLLLKAAEGVKVSLIYDAVGSITTPLEFFDRLRDGGVSVCAFNPLNPVRRPGYWGITHRDHRKLLVVDEDAAFTGGINISRVYGSSSFGRRRAAASRDSLTDGWRDTQIELEGPVVPVLAKVFESTWRDQGCKGELGTPAPRRGAAEPGQRVVKVLPSDAREPENRIYSALLAGIDAAQVSVRLTIAYFAPGSDFVQALIEAARRGVAVELVLPGRGDSLLALHAGRSYYTDLLEAGVRIHEMQHAVMHAKTAVIDGVFSTVGSSNLDWLSFVTNNELNVIVLGDDFGAEMTALFEKDRAASEPVTLEAWHQRGLHLRMFEGMSRMIERWL
ncbi:phosphatidylserine/phosphatidylglycerophosphate/cardiolipin synthase family protein [Hydrogenophaga sp.]|uniref:phospholipase D-like domain-containing protein n=1 Tax=Hydrogenophaga sp. TaxID=1904254 RepID=UPI0027229CE5|nr:phospholipase D-like domain-containing protein [Hydrogenophaga sp.]MDO8906354.1 phospholipase D-like domain-containing protein [Hydrogenophaga sp.]